MHAYLLYSIHISHLLWPTLLSYTCFPPGITGLSLHKWKLASNFNQLIVSRIHLMTSIGLLDRRYCILYCESCVYTPLLAVCAAAIGVLLAACVGERWGLILYCLYVFKWGSEAVEVGGMAADRLTMKKYTIWSSPVTTSNTTWSPSDGPGEVEEARHLPRACTYMFSIVYLVNTWVWYTYMHVHYTYTLTVDSSLSERDKGNALG